MSRAPKPKETRADIAFAQLKEAIMNSELPAGHQAMEPELALKYGVSRTTIREALIRLEAEGLIEMVPRRGARVLPIAAEDMHEIYQLLISLESDAAHDLTSRGLTEAEHALLQSTIKDMASALDQENLAEWARADDAFHRSILDMHGNRRLGRIVASLSDQAHRARFVTRGLRPLPKQSVEDHQQILDAMVEGDASTARDLYRAHRKRGAQEIMEILGKLPQL